MKKTICQLAIPFLSILIGLFIFSFFTSQVFASCDSDAQCTIITTSNVCCTDSSGYPALCNDTYTGYCMPFLRQCFPASFIGPVTHVDRCYYGCYTYNGVGYCSSPPPTPIPTSTSAPSPTSPPDATPTDIPPPGSTPTDIPTPTQPPATPTPANCSFWCANDANQCSTSGCDIVPGACGYPSNVCCDCHITPTPIATDKPPPTFQVYSEVANLSAGEVIPDLCGEGSSSICNSEGNNGWYFWPPSCRPSADGAIRQTTNASLGDQILLRVCLRKIGGYSASDRAVNVALWLNLNDTSNPKSIPLLNAGEHWQYYYQGGWGNHTPTPGTYDYNGGTPQPSYTWLEPLWEYTGNTFNWCGSNSDFWPTNCVKNIDYKFTIKNEASLNGKTASAKGFTSITPYVNPPKFHKYVSHCADNSLNSLGFWDRTPDCCWGAPNYKNDVGGWSGCPIREADPRYNQCRYAPCDTGENSENFVFWSNWASIDITVPSAWMKVVDGDVHANRTDLWQF